MQPINYGVEIEDPTKSFLSAFQTGSAIQDTRLKQEEQTQKMAQQKLIQDSFAKLRGPNATATDYANLSMILPKDQSDAVRKSFEMLSGERQQNALRQAGQVFSAFKAGKPEIAIQLMDQNIESKRNSGDEAGAKFLETMRDVSKVDPKAGEIFFGNNLVQMTGGDKLIEAANKLAGEARTAAEAPAELKKKIADANAAVADAEKKIAEAKDTPARLAAEQEKRVADAEKAKIDAQYAEQKAKADLEQTLATTRKTDADILIAKEDNRIKALNAAQAKETNVLRRQELQQKINDATEKRDSTKLEQQGALATIQADVDNFVNTATQVLNTPIEVIRSATGPISSRLPTMNQEVADFESLVETLGSQVFIAQIPKIKGAGALSEKEGDKLQASVQNLSLKQSPDQLKKNVTEAVRLLQKARGNAAARAGLPSTPIDVPAALEVIVQLPNKQSVKFPNQAAANAFKKQAGIP